MTMTKDNFIVIGNGRYAKCQNCGKWVKVNKMIFGSLHICLTEEEIRETSEKQGGTQKAPQNSHFEGTKNDSSD